MKLRDSRLVKSDPIRAWLLETQSGEEVWVTGRDVTQERVRTQAELRFPEFRLTEITVTEDDFDYGYGGSKT